MKSTILARLACLSIEVSKFTVAIFVMLIVFPFSLFSLCLFLISCPNERYWSPAFMGEFAKSGAAGLPFETPM